MDVSKCLDDLANLASAVTASVAVWAYGSFRIAKRLKRQKLEIYLAGEFAGKRGAGDTGARTILHLVSALGIGESDILDAAFASDLIETVVAADPDSGRADCIFLRHRR